MSGSLQLSLELGIWRTDGRSKRFRKQYSWSSNFAKRVCHSTRTSSCTNHQFRCHCFLKPGPCLDPSSVKNAALTLARSFNSIEGSRLVIKLASTVGIVLFAIWGLGPLVRLSRKIFLQKNDGNWKKSGTYLVTTTYIQPFLLWMGAIFICRALDPMTVPTEAGQMVKQRLLTFVRSLSTVLAFAYCLSSVIQQLQKYLIETTGSSDSRNMGFQFATRAVYTAVWVAAISLFMELLGFSAQKWLTAGGFGTVLLTLAGREIFTNFLSSAMIHATRPFVINEWIQTKIDGYEVSGTVERVGWWSPTIIRGEDREAVHIPNYKFTMNVVRNLSQKTHWRIKSHIAISHLDVRKINNIVADMRKVLAKNPQVEHKKLHRRVFLENINLENQALMILVSCFVKTSHMEEYLCVKETILLDLLRVVRHHGARLATPIRTVQKILNDAELDNVPFSDSMYDQGTVSNRPLLLIEPSTVKSNGEDKTKSQARPGRVAGEEDKAPAKSTSPDNKPDAKGERALRTDSKSEVSASPEHVAKDMQTLDVKAETDIAQMSKTEKEDSKVAEKSSSDPKHSNSAKPVEKIDTKSVEGTSSMANVSSSSIDNASNSRHSQKTGQETTSTAASSPESGFRRSNNAPSSSSSYLKQEGRQPATSGKPSLEENIVLGVALEGSKRTLPIEEEDESPLNPEDSKELATLRSSNSNGPAVAEKEKSDDAKKSNSPDSQGSDQLGQQE